MPVTLLPPPAPQRDLAACRILLGFAGMRPLSTTSLIPAGRGKAGVASAPHMTAHHPRAQAGVAENIDGVSEKLRAAVPRGEALRLPQGLTP